MALQNTDTDGKDPFAGRSLAQKYQLRGLETRRRTGLVYLADARGRAEAVTILIGHRELGEAALGGFTRESARLVELRHPNLIEVLDHGRESGHPYLVLERLGGEALDARIAARKRLALAEFVPIAAQLLKAVGHLHARKQVLRDLEPCDVVLVEHKGRADFVKLIDFGFGDLLAGGRAVTKEHVVGHAGYLSPEAIRSDPLEAAADVYSLGAIFYHMLAGRPPFEGDTRTAVFHRTLHDQPIELGKLVDESVPPGLVELVHRCLTTDPKGRPADADAIVESLIDVVPASLFRLRRAGDAAASSTSSMLGLRDSTRPAHDSSAVMPSLTTSAEISMPRGIVPPPAATARRPSKAVMIAGIAAIVSISAAVLVGITHGDDETPQAASPTTSTVPVAATPEPQPAVAAPAPPPIEQPATMGHVKIGSTPVADLDVDDQLLGTTPFSGELPLGRHTVRLSADGYEDWVGTIEVRAGANLPVQVQLLQPAPEEQSKPERGTKKKGKGKGGGSGSTSKAASAPEPKDDGVFLPTGK